MIILLGEEGTREGEIRKRREVNIEFRDLEMHPKH
jgi:hypothetical protein